MGFTSYETPTVTAFGDLTVAQKNGIVDDYVSGLGITEIKHKRMIPSSYIRAGINKIKGIERVVVAMMRGDFLITPEASHIDETSGEKVIDSAAVYNTTPNLRGDLETLVIAAYPDCSVTALDYVVDKVIDEATNAGTWAAFKALDWS